MSPLILQIGEILIPSSRQRSVLPEEHIEELAQDIAVTGLIHAPTVYQNESSGDYELVAGHCRIEAVKRLKSNYRYGVGFLPPTEIPVVVINNLSENELFRIELMENLRRINLSPVDEARAVARLHSYMQTEHGPQWTKDQTGAELVRTKAFDGTSAESAGNKVAESIILSSFADDPDVQKASTRKAALRIAKKKAEIMFTQSLAAFAENKTEHLLIPGDLTIVLPTLPENSFSGIIADPPYGIEAHAFGEQTMAGGHAYEDSALSALKLAEFILEQGYRICRDDAHLYMFCDIRFWPTLLELAASCKWQPFATPLIWYKPGIGHAPQPGLFGRRYEAILFAKKGNRNLAKVHSDVFEFPSVKNKVHAAQKPVELIQELLSLSFFPGESVLDPCCGAGTIFSAAHRQKLKATGIEADPGSVGLSKAAIEELSK